MRSRLAELRNERHLSVNKLAFLTGVPRHLITRIEEGLVKKIPLDAIQRLCNFFECGIEEIIYFERTA